MNRIIKPEDWSPIEVEDLEPAAFEVVRSTSNCSVIAGPGAGKTELLAQRACFLFQTGICRYPQRILAISFKKDAAKNLKDRVTQRCGPEYALRFDSFTFDAFAKGMLDRFFGALPDKWRPPADYEIYFPNYRTFGEFLNLLDSPPSNVATMADLKAVPQNSFEKDHVLGSPLPVAGIAEKDAASWAAKRWWDECLHRGKKSRLTFPMIGRLVELLLRVNPKIRNALHATYSQVFMDEFQDTTHVQYDLVKTAFIGSHSVLTAVGDNKQQIMRWAMALDNAFGEFERDFNAKRVPLTRNYRSSPALVRMQHRLALAVDPNCKPAISMKSNELTEDACVILEFETPHAEAKYLAEAIVTAMKTNNLMPRNFAILVRQKPQDYAPLLISVLSEFGIKARIEAELQDLLAEPLTAILIAFLRFGSKNRAGADWTNCCQILANIRGVELNDDPSGQTFQREIDDFHFTLRKQMKTLPDSGEKLGDFLKNIVNFIGEDHIKLTYQQYRQGEWFNTVFEQITEYLGKSCQVSQNWVSALDDFEGRDTVPIMTIHKSKGLEYHTVIFVGLDDSAWWSFRNQPEESRSAFFVAFSRAKQRVFFTYCEERGGRREIASLYELLKSAGVKTQSIDN